MSFAFKRGKRAKMSPAVRPGLTSVLIQFNCKKLLEALCMKKNERCRKLPIIKSQKSPWGGGLQPDGTIQFPFPIYIKSVSDWHEALYELNLTDKNYYDNYEKIKINRLTI